MFGATVAWSHRASLIENFSSRDGDDADTANTDGQVRANICEPDTDTVREIG